ncbi:SDR family oxidoreductase [Mycobacterium antarcticum]|uniref:SDR family oxidoreductase n=1 Tax=Mycolicibacterium sp. TUM20983 TaxID=3023369 RepID=UPI0024E0A09C|nr:SDR family oxidoreductase [Mycolicibacterium sp. TUM20983]
MNHSRIRTVLVTGASRGIGAEVAQQLASPDTHVIVNYRQKTDRAEAVAQTIREAGGLASTLGADISDEAERVAMMATIAARFGGLDALVLNASGGPDLGTDPQYAMRLNRDAQRHLAQLAVPLMPAGARIVFVTSHQAHFFPNKAVPKGYSAVAASKRAGETALYTMRFVFSRSGVGLTVVSGDVTEGTSVVPTVDEFARAIVAATIANNPPGIVYVGSADYRMTA